MTEGFMHEFRGKVFLKQGEKMRGNMKKGREKTTRVKTKKYECANVFFRLGEWTER